HFGSAFVVSFAGLVLGAAVGWQQTGTLAGTSAVVFIVAVLAVLEGALSFDNAGGDARVLQESDEGWGARVITGGIAIAVFGMRIVFPLVIVAVVARIGPLDAVWLAATAPHEYSRILHSAHISVSAFGGAFLAMVGLKHFFDREKDVHWIAAIER